MKLKHASAVALAALTATSAVAIAKVKPTVKPSKNAAIGKTIVVNAKGATLYRLKGETKSHMLCADASCVGFWPPLTVRSAHTKVVAGKGVKGKLGVFKRPDGKFQVTLRGLPLYRFSGDSAKGQANGEGIVSFGGTWHVVPAKSGSGAAAPAPAPPSPYSPY
jgi:predicted lipoprotein with Yx(FWY)xxD motif